MKQSFVELDLQLSVEGDVAPSEYYSTYANVTKMWSDMDSSFNSSSRVHVMELRTQLERVCKDNTSIQFISIK